MRKLRIFFEKGLFFSLLVCFFLLAGIDTISAEGINWIEVASTNNEIQFIDNNSIKYNNKGFLSVLTKYSQVNPDNNDVIITESYLLAIDCEKRLFSKLSLNSELKQVKDWTNPIDDKLIKKTIINTCSY